MTLLLHCPGTAWRVKHQKVVAPEWSTGSEAGCFPWQVCCTASLPPKLKAWTQCGMLPGTMPVWV